MYKTFGNDGVQLRQLAPPVEPVEVTEHTPLKISEFGQAAEPSPDDSDAEDTKEETKMEETFTQMTAAVPPVMPSKLPKPWWSYLMFCGCLIGFAYSLAQQKGIAPLDQNPMIGPTAQVLVDCGAKYTPFITLQGEWWRLLTPMWLHAGIIHLATNLNMLYRMGFAFERGIGTPRFAFLYLVSGFTSMVYSAVFASQAVTVGASGALFGILGAMLGEMAQNCHLLSTKERICGFITLMLTILLNLAVGLLPFVDNFAHFFGCMSGLLLGMSMILYKDHRKHLKFRQVYFAVFAGAMYCILLAIGVLLLYFRVEGHEFCPWCKYISCVPSPWWSCDLAPLPARGNMTSTHP